jgi:ADP-ribose pyrophosphatase YjhB (NUDIX family)/ketosteroid isomerase-like protein
MPVSDPLDLVRAFYHALNRGDLEAVTALYHPDCIVEYVFTGDGTVYEGREVVRRQWAAELERFAGALENGHRVDVTRVAGIETGWGWVRADWSSAVTDLSATPGRDVEASGYSYFWLEDGLIRRHRSVSRGTDGMPRRATSAPRPAGAELVRPQSPREYPSQPVVGIGAIVIDGAGRVLLVKRRYEPLAGQWSLPGGALEVGETLEAGVAREIREETGLVVDVGPVVEVFDRILVDESGQVRYHFVLVDYLCAIAGGALQAGSDVDDAQFVDPAELASRRVAAKARDVIERALRMRMNAS